MRTSSLILLLAFCTPMLMWAQDRGQDASPPSAVATAFETHFSSAIYLRWRAEPNGYMASFQLKGLDAEAFFTPKGIWKYTRTVVPQHLIPKIAMEHFQQRYGSYRMHSIFYYDSHEGSYFRIYVDRGRERLELRYDYDGHFIQALRR